ncbi:hypothetical protein CRUP_024239 [Coryphaenoides rupestris]|nr:hypothetical protein CRUP_024239 [Coryphaenoides rupestris]
MQLTACEPTDVSAAVGMAPAGPGGFLQSSSKAEDSAASLEDITTDTANESSEEESAGEREEQTRDNEDIVITTSNTQKANARRPDSLSVVALAGGVGSGLWTCQRDGEVKLRMGEAGMAAETPLTVNQLFTSAVERFPDVTALGWKEGERRLRLSYREYYQSCRNAAKSFLKLGLERYHGVGILGFNSAEWFIADIGTILAGGFAVGIYTTNSAEACQYVADNSKANIIVVENNKQLQKILQVQDQLPHLKAIVQYKDELKEKKPNVYTWAEFMELGRDEPDAMLDDIISSQKPNQCCTLIYTSGTTGQPKGVMLSHDNMVDIWVTMRVGGATYFAQPDALKGSLVTTLKEVRPTAFMGVPRVWEKMQEKMRSVGAKSSTVRRKVASWAKDVGLQANLSKMNQSGTVGRPPLNFRLAKRLVFKKVRKALGLDRCRRCYTGAAPITRDTLEFFLSLDVPLYELCGKEIEGCKTKIHKPDEEGNGEICFWGRHLFMEIIITAGGENIPPVPIEDAVKETVPLVSNAMLIGDKRKFLSMLLTLKCQVNEETGAPTDELTPEAVAACQKLGSSATRVSEVCGGRDRAVHAAIQEGITLANERATSNAQRIQKPHHETEEASGDEDVQGADRQFLQRGGHAQHPRQPTGKIRAPPAYHPTLVTAGQQREPEARGGVF